MKKLLAATLAAYLLLCAACTPIPAPTPMPAVPDDPSVKTDWSHLSPYESEKPVYTRRFAEFTNSLIPADDYGPLIPFLGDKLGGVGGEGERYGLVTLDGEVVVDPVFSNVWRGDSSGGYHNASPLPYMMLSKGVSSPSRDKWPGGGGWAMAALDGSWCTEFKYAMDSELTIWGWDINSNCTEEGIFLMDGDALVYLDGATGRELLRIEDIPEDKRHDALFSVRRDGSGAVYQCYDDNAQGTDHYRQTFRADASGSRRLTGLEAELAQLRFQDGKALRYPDEGGAQVLDEVGNVLLRTVGLLDYRPGTYIEYQDVTDQAGRPYMEILAVYAADTLEQVADSPLTGRWVQSIPVGEMWYWCRERENVLFFQGNEVYPFAWSEDPGGIMWGRVARFSGEQGYSVVTLDGTVLTRDIEYENFAHFFDRVTGEPYIQVREGRRLLFYDEDGKLLHTFTAAPAERGVLANGLLLVTGPDSSGLRSETGEWIFRWPLPSGEWD